MKILSILFLMLFNCNAVSDDRENLPKVLKIPALFSDNQVIQREVKVPVWGWDIPSTNVNVKFNGQSITTVADQTGKWQLYLEPMKASFEPQKMIINGSSVIINKNILIGEVWLCSGQSNMAMNVFKAKVGPEYAKKSDHPGLRLFHLTPSAVSTQQPLEDCVGSWLESSEENVMQSSAAGYFFILELHKKLKVPVGLIKSAWGGSAVECWMSKEALLSNIESKPIWENFIRSIENFDESKATPEHEVSRLMDIYRKAKAKSIKEKTKRPSLPKVVRNPVHARFAPTNFFNTMIAPVIPYAIKGAIWYQGESNRDRAEQYMTTFPLMVRDWRERFKQGDFPFYYVQIANLGTPNSEPADSEWAELQYAQTHTMKVLDNVGMVTINDYPNTREDNNLHPKNKLVVGQRLALWALAKTYNFESVQPSGPLYRAMTREKGQIRLHFDFAGKGLKSRDGKKLRRFQICGNDRKWHWADAEIEERTVVVRSNLVKSPVAVRYAWSANANTANLTNESGLPAPVFRTDSWPLSTKGKILPKVIQQF